METSFMKVNERFLEGIDLLISAGYRLLDGMKAQEAVAQRNLIVYAFVRKATRLLAALRTLIATGFEEEAQILARALIETRINFEYFLLMAREDYKNAFGRAFAALILDKLKALRASHFMVGDHHVDRELWEEIEGEIRASSGDVLVRQLSRCGFSGISLDARAAKTGNKDLYTLAYRLYSRNVHATDIHEQLRGVWMQELFSSYEDTLLPALLEASRDCGRVVMEGANDWLGDPLGIKATGAGEGED